RDAAPVRAPGEEEPAGGFRCLYAGSLDPLKGLPTVLTAAAATPDVEFVILGGRGPDLVADRWASNVRFAGAVPGAAGGAELRPPHALLLPHAAAAAGRYHSPLKLFEYLAAGRAILASDLPATREILTHGQNAWLCAPEDPQALADGIALLPDDPSRACAA